MIKIDSTNFGSVTISGIKYGDILIIGEKIILRDQNLLEKLYGTSHKIGSEEIEKLLEGGPEVIIVGAGQSGALDSSPELEDAASDNNVQLIFLNTPEAIEEFNKQVENGKRVNALIHVTC